MALAEGGEVHAVERLEGLAADAAGEEVRDGVVGERDHRCQMGGEVDVELSIGAQASLSGELGDGGEAMSVMPRAAIVSSDAPSSTNRTLGMQGGRRKPK